MSARRTGHVKDDGSRSDRSQQTKQRRHMRFELENRHGAKQYNDRQRSDQRGDPPLTNGVVALLPGAGMRVSGEQIRDARNDKCKSCQPRQSSTGG